MTDSLETAPLRRWNDHVVGRSDRRYGFGFEEILKAAVRPGTPSLYVMGLGFDPRATVAFETAASLLSPGSRVLAIVPKATSGGTSRESGFQKSNEARARELAARYSLELEIIQPNPNAKDTRFHGVWLVRKLRGRQEWDTPHVVVDISSLPSAIFFALIRAWLVERTAGLQLQVVAAESHQLDDLILDSGALAPQFLPGFNEHGSLEELQDSTRIWIPVLGHGRLAQMEAIGTAFNPHDICPVVPFPAPDPRRGDSLVAEYGELLFDTLDVDAQKFIYADGSNPFDLYKVLLTISDRYKRALRPLGQPVIVPSTHGSKLLSLGVLLGAFEADLSVVNAGAPVSTLSEDADDELIQALVGESQQTCLWLAGEPYDTPHPVEAEVEAVDAASPAADRADVLGA
jgi:hypothetical protein